MRDIDDVLDRLATSAFRRRFKLSDADRAYLAQKGLVEVLDHARSFIDKRLAPPIRPMTASRHRFAATPCSSHSTRPPPAAADVSQNGTTSNVDARSMPTSRPISSRSSNTG
jgi:hypothetical protein